ncbi:MAG: glutaredoxin family protein [Deltaproteobacteria bacterium]|uniref:NrdH-redoxin n=1 Tax=candidate division Kazan bacterium TaxID=2202143 RepID=A0A420ZBE4_UNCK3|nr:glutaredoxin family protein [Deltaproteobacteria bacterium]RLC36370.1 MAG: NrdH-redoxin [candidate division Kazan bacterium]MBW1920151.1 glutaredoxin family protein [Deltaproteobacteria bacterium]MBW1932979.1 glutaredoxin family protein [Deltaproteobacteria bacterium]MBW1978782.1 glutaredoxin family protein [Deltaproteobacteria bacterium]
MPVSSQPRIIIFTSSSCPWCNRVKQYLREKRFRFREVNVERDADGARELRRRNIKGVPVVLINNKPIIGFDKAKIDKLLPIR